MEEILCFDRVVVSDPVVDGERVRVEYALSRRGQKSEKKELFVHYHGLKLDLAATPGLLSTLRLLAAQPVVSLGPFCREIVFDFAFDPREMNLLKEIFRSIAREIYINRIVPGGPCLKEQAHPTQFTLRKSYCQAKLRAEIFEERSLPLKSPEDRFGVLLSGSPEGLLSFGILRELGLSALPILHADGPKETRRPTPLERALESGGIRHVRVTSNLSSLLLAFSESMKILKAEECRKNPEQSPLRLYLQGPGIFLALPVLLREKIGNLVVPKDPRPPLAGIYRGVPHFHGLYDRTRYFDDLLVRGFSQRGWDFHPFSLTLSLSRMLVERMLGRRYPDLFALQSWCPSPIRSTASSPSPCGRCEPCLVMLTLILAEGLDPEKVGLRERDLERLQKQGPPRTGELEPLMEHAAFKLAQRGFLPSPTTGGWEKIAARPHPHLEKVFFDNRRSFLDTIPISIRRKVYQIFLEYARGSAVLSEQGWLEFSLMDSKEVDREKTLF